MGDETEGGGGAVDRAVDRTGGRAVGGAGGGAGDGFPHLLAPGSIGPMAVRNRIVMTPMGDRLAEDDGTVSERQAAYLEARARGGAGLLVIGSVAVAYPEGAYATCQTAISEDRMVPGLAALAERVQRHGARLAAQLVHDGASSLLDVAEGRDVLVPSKPPRIRPDALSAMVTPAELDAMTRPFTTPTSRFGYREATEADIADVIDRFADAAERARAAGLDGVEVHAGHGYLIDSFLSPVRNRREDGWGGDVTGRARLLVEVLRAVKARVGDDLAVWVRLNGEERHVDGGETLDDALVVARLAVDAGADAVHVSAYADPGVGVGVTDAHTPQRAGRNLPLAAAVKGVVDVPVIAVGRLEPEAADRAIAEGQADLVAMGRALLADPDLPAKLAAGRVDDVRPCIYQYRCIGNIFLNEPLACVANPATAHGDEAGPSPTSAPRRIVVVGGGPAGMEAAHVLAAAGHDVVLVEQRPVLGGTLVAAGAADADLDRFLGWQRRQVAASGADVRLATAATPEVVAELAPDLVVVATGGRWSADVGAPVGDTPVHTLGSVATSGWFADDDGPTGAVAAGVLVVGGGKAALSFARLAVARGRVVTVVEPSGVPAPELGPPGRFRLAHDAAADGVDVRAGWQVTGVASGRAAISGPDGFGGTATDEVPADVVVVAASGPDPAAAGGLATGSWDVVVLGDAADAGRLEGALASARALVSRLS